MSDYEDFDAENDPALGRTQVKPNSERPTKSQPAKKPRIQKSYRKKVESEWSQEQILKLIEEIEMRPGLWDSECAEYKLPKEIFWQEVADAVHATVNDCKGKWAHLRITFKSNLNKYRENKLGRGAGESIHITWKYFKPMMFLATQSTRPNSSMELNPTVNDDLFLRDLRELKFLPPSPVTSGQRRRKQRTTQSAPTPPPSDARGETSLKEMAAEALQSLQSRCLQAKNPSIALCDYMASELENLKPEQAEFARCKLRHAFTQIMDEAMLMPSSRQKQAAGRQEQSSGKKRRDIRSKAADNRNY